MNDSSGTGQLEIRYTGDGVYLPVEAKEIVCVGIALDDEISAAMAQNLANGLIDKLIPDFASLPHCDSSGRSEKSFNEAALYIGERGFGKKLNSVLFPSIDVVPPGMEAMAGQPGARITFAVGIITSVPEGKEPKVFIIEGEGSDPAIVIAKALRVRKQNEQSQGSLTQDVGNSGEAAEDKTNVEKTGGCFVATACYGSLDHPYVVSLRSFRDEKILPYRAGAIFVKLYYSISPPIARLLERSRWLRWVVRRLMIEPLVKYISR